MEEDRTVLFSELMKDYHPSEFISKEWPMKDGLYQQYSGFENDVECPSGTHSSIVML